MTSPKASERVSHPVRTMSGPGAAQTALALAEPVWRSDVPEGTCSTEGCERPVACRGMCRWHYRRSWKKSQVDALRRRETTTHAELFWTYVDKTETCWLWTGKTDASGYGYYRGHGAHRYAYEMLVGPIPDGLQLDHLCHTNDGQCRRAADCSHRRCVRPDHLEPVTASENVRRGASTRALCPNGHPLEGENLSFADGHRICRECRRNTNREGTRRWRASAPTRRTTRPCPSCDGKRTGERRGDSWVCRRCGAAWENTE